MAPLKLLIVEDSEDDALLVAAELRHAGFDVRHRIVESEEELRTALADETWDAVITDYLLPGFDGLEAIRIITELSLDMPVIIVSGAIGEDVAVAAMRAGAHDYLMKDNLARLGAVMRRELGEAESRRAMREAEAAQRESEARYRAIVEDQTDLVVRWKPDGTRTFVNRAYRSFFSQPREELVGGNLLDHVLPGERAKVVRKIASLSPLSPVSLDERRVLARDGEVSWQEWVDRGIFDDAGELLELQSVGRDITERKNSAEAERQKALLVEVLRDTAAVLNSTIDLDEVFDRILANVGWVIPHDAAAIFFVANGNAEVIRLRGWEDLGIENIPSSLPLSADERGVLAEMVGTGKPMVIQDTSADPRWTTGPRRLGWVGSFAAAPLFDESGMYGIMALFCAEADHFSSTHMELLEGFASHAATATRNARLFEAVSLGREQLRDLSAKIVGAQEQERRRISRELHDEVGQSLTVMILNTDFMIDQFGESIPEKARERLEDISGLAKTALEQIRGLSLRLRPAMLDELGLEPTLAWMIDGYSKHTELPVELVVEGCDDHRLGESLETTLYRAVQEGLTNVARHARASKALVTLRCDAAEVVLTIEDNGRGFSSDPTARVHTDSAGLGLVGMTERVGHLHGTVDVESWPDKGTKIHIHIPREFAESESPD